MRGGPPNPEVIAEIRARHDIQQLTPVKPVDVAGTAHESALTISDSCQRTARWSMTRSAKPALDTATKAVSKGPPADLVPRGPNGKMSCSWYECNTSGSPRELVSDR